jgi:AraC family transcriptional regulator
MFLRIETLREKKLVGKHLKMSFTKNKTGDLWRSFMPMRNTIKNKAGSELYSAEVYEPFYFDDFNPSKEFDKWAAIAVTNFENIPEGMNTIIFPNGLYAVFLHKGPASLGANTYQYIFQTWLPTSNFVLDNRPHFAVMNEKYKHEDPSSEEEIWIPVKPKAIN